MARPWRVRRQRPGRTERPMHRPQRDHPHSSPGHRSSASAAGPNVQAESARSSCRHDPPRAPWHSLDADLGTRDPVVTRNMARWHPHSAAPVVVSKWTTQWSREQEGFAVRTRQAATSEVFGEQLDQGRGASKRPYPCLTLGRSERRRTCPSGALLGNSDRPAQEVDATDSQSGTLAPPQAESGTTVRHEAIVRPESSSKARNLFRGDLGPVELQRLGELYAAAGRATDVVVIYRVGEDGSRYVELAGHRPGLGALGPHIDHYLHVPLADKPKLLGTQLRKDMQPQDGLIACPCARTSSRQTTTSSARRVNELSK